MSIKLENSLLIRIRDVDKTTSSEEKVLRYIEANYPQIAFETIHSISENCNVGKATVTRFVVRLGYLSFSDFMNKLRQEVTNQLETPIQRLSTLKDEKPQDAQEHFDSYADFAIKNINRTKSRIRPKDFEQAVELLSNNKGTLYIAGSATSYGLAYFYFTLATYMRSNVVLLDASPSALSHTLIDINEKDTVLAILHYRFSTQTIKIVEWFSEKNASVVLISDRERTPVSKMATVQLFSSSGGKEMFNSRISTLMLLESLLANMATKLEKNIYNRFETFDSLSAKFDTLAVPSRTTVNSSLNESKKIKNN